MLLLYGDGALALKTTPAFSRRYLLENNEPFSWRSWCHLSLTFILEEGVSGLIARTTSLLPIPVVPNTNRLIRATATDPNRNAAPAGPPDTNSPNSKPEITAIPS